MERLSVLIQREESDKAQDNRNEAQTRFDLIDELLDILQWEKGANIRVENYEERARTDYELGIPRCCIWEAKREGAAFHIPAGYSGQQFTGLRSLYNYCGDVEGAVEQAQRYCARRGVQLAVITNGHQLISFLATRDDGIAPLDGKCIVFESLSSIHDNFPVFWDLLSKPGVREKNYLRILSGSFSSPLPAKLSQYLPEYPKFRYPSDLQVTLRTMGDLLIYDIPDSMEEDFYRRCYCKSGALTQESLLSKEVLRARYAALFGSEESAPKISPVSSKGNEGESYKEIRAEAMNRRPIVLLGDVGVGKTSFLKNLIYVDAPEVFKDSIYVYIDLANQAVLTQDLRSFVLGEVDRQLYDRYQINSQEESLIKGVYASEIARFKDGIQGAWSRSEVEFQAKLLEHLNKKIQDTSGHLQRCVNHLSKGRHKQIIILIDNADQRDDGTQQESFLIAQEFAANWEAAVFLALRPNTFFRSRRSGALSAYPHRVFVVPPPRVEEVVEKRLLYALDLASSSNSPALERISIKLPSVIGMLEVLLDSLKNSSQLREFLVNITGGNVRDAIEFVKSFIGSPNVDSKKIISFYEHGKKYVIPVHEFTKQALLGDYAHYDPKSSIALNIYDANSASSKYHFLFPCLLGFLLSEDDSIDKNGFYSTEGICLALQGQEFTLPQIEDALRRATNKKLIETSNRVTFEETAGELGGDLPTHFRITSRGAYHLRRWSGSFAYLDAMVIDTPIFDEDLRQELMSLAPEFRIEARLERTIKFRDYLLVEWRSNVVRCPFLDFEELVRANRVSFDRVSAAVRKQNWEEGG